MYLASYQENPETKLGNIQKESLDPIRIYIEKFLNIQLPIHYDFQTSEFLAENKEKLENLLKTFVRYKEIYLFIYY